jgi:hypothetical protein
MADNNSDILQEIRDRFAISHSAEAHNRIKGVDDLRFLNGDQWPAKIKRDRVLADRPCETINKLPSHLDQILGEIRRNKLAIKVRPTGKPSSKDTAEILEGIIRSIENLSKADIAYKTGSEGAISSGRGAWEIITDYVDDDVFEQEIRIKRIKNPYTVYFDPSATEWDKSDGKYAFITEWMTDEEYKKEYPNAGPSNFQERGIGDNEDRWYRRKSVRVVRYFVKVPKTKTILLLSDGRVVEKEKWDSIVDDLKANERVHHANADGVVVEGPAIGEGVDSSTEIIINEVPTVERTREVESHEVMIYIASGAEILSGPHPWAGKYIPIVPVWGKEININGEDYVRGQIRFAKGPQRMYNYERNAEIERVALAKIPPVRLTQEQIEGHEHLWNSEANLKYQLYNHIPNQPPPQDINPPGISSGNVAQSSIAADEIKATTSIFDASLGAKSNETSGIAIRERKVQGNIANYVYLDNLVRAIQFTGDILVDLVPRIYDTQRQEMILGEDGGQKEITINQEVMDEASGTKVIINDLSLGKYTVRVSVGPHYNTQRQETAATLTELAGAIPMVGQVGADLIISNLDFKGADELAERLRKLLPPEVAGDDGEPTEPKPPTPEEMVAQIEAQGKEIENQGKQLDNQRKQLDNQGQELDNAETKLDITQKSVELKQFVKDVAQGAAAGAVTQTLEALGIDTQGGQTSGPTGGQTSG